jgi:hypothetical protein
MAIDDTARGFTVTGGSSNCTAWSRNLIELLFTSG